jgi:hypothetical protein
MTRVFGICVLSLLVSVPAFAQRKSCEELAADIAAKLDAKGVKGYKIDIVAADQVGDQQVVGSCDGGAKRITYKKDAGSQGQGSK